MASIFSPVARPVARYQRNAAQAGTFPGTTQADFDVAVGTPIGVTRIVGGNYRLDLAGVWRVSAAMLLQGTAGGAHRPRIQLVNNTAGTIEFYQEQHITIGTNTHGMLMECLLRANLSDELQVFWETDVAASDLQAPGSIGCTLAFEWVAP